MSGRDGKHNLNSADWRRITQALEQQLAYYEGTPREAFQRTFDKVKHLQARTVIPRCVARSAGTWPCVRAVGHRGPHETKTGYRWS